MSGIRTILQTAGMFIALSSPSLHPSLRAQTDRPNILFILADDLGYSDPACYGNPWFETPHLDKLASAGIRFTNAYAAAPICSASRAAILTGKTPARLGFEFVTKNAPGFQPIEEPLRAPPYSLDLPLEEETIAERLGRAGYKTAFFGKWHLNQHFQKYLGWSPTHGPKAQGFQIAEEDFGSHPYSYEKKNGKPLFLDLPSGEFVPDSMTEKAVSFLKQDHDRPFFLMVSHFYVHDPVNTRMKWLYDYYLETIPEDHPRRELLAHYGAMVTSLDHYTGQLIEALDEADLTDSTLIVFTSDNGGHPNYAGNAPLRGSKWNLYEGGIRVPVIVQWPGSDSSGIVVDSPVWSLDFFPTFAEVAGIKSSTGREGRSLLPLVRNPDKTSPRDGNLGPMIWHFPYYHPERGYREAPGTIGIDDGVTSRTTPQSAILKNGWKLIHFYEEDRNELYEIASDPAESNDLSRKREELAASLHRDLFDYLNNSGARLPVLNPDFQRKNGSE